MSEDIRECPRRVGERGVALESMPRVERAARSAALRADATEESEVPDRRQGLPDHPPPSGGIATERYHER